MKSFLKYSSLLCILIFGFKLAQAEIGLSPAAENALASSNLEQALYRLMALPPGSVLVRRPPVESRAELDSLIQQSATNGALFAVRAQEDERQLDFKAAEKDWRQAADLSKDKQSALGSLADFYSRRLQPQQEVQTLLQLANLPARSSEVYKKSQEQDSWQAIHRALTVAAESKLPAETRASIYEAWIKRYPKDTEPLRSYFQLLVDNKKTSEARAAASRIKAVFPSNISLTLQTEADLARLESGDRAALDVYAKQFSPLWPSDLRADYYSLLTEAHQLRSFLAEARNESAANPTALDPVLRAFFYYEQAGKTDVAGQQLLELESRRAARNTGWNAAELKTVAALFTRLSEYDEAAHAYYNLYALPGAADSDKALALSSLINLLLDVPEQSLQFGSRDLSIYRNVATLDRHPGFLNGILSLILNTTQPEDQYQQASQASIAYFHRAMAAQLIERMKTEFPNSRLTPPLESKLFSAYSVYGQNDAIMRLAPAWLSGHKNAADYTTVALLLAGTYSTAGKVTQELPIYDGLLQKLAEASGHRPLGDVSDSANENGDAKANAARSPEYSHVLDLYISRLTQLKRIPDAVGIYRREIDRNPDDPGLYERLALFVEQNQLDSDLEQTYRAAMKRFDGPTWSEKLARFYIRKKQSDAYVALAKDVTDRFEGSDLARYLSSVPPGSSFGPLVYRQVNLYAHQRFPHNLVFVGNLLSSYQVKGFVDMAAYEKLLRENWYNDASLRTVFFEYLSRTNKLQAELAALPKPQEAAQQKNTAALLQYAEGHAWLAEFEEAAPAFAAMANLNPGDDELATRTISVERSLAPSVPGAFERAIRLAEQRGRALPANESAATLVGEIYADRDLCAKAAPWWNRVSLMRPGLGDGYLTSATVFWDYYQFADSLRVIQNARAAVANPALYAYEAGAIHENQSDLPGAIEEYLKAIMATPPPVLKKAKPRPVSNEEGEADGEMDNGDRPAPADEGMAQERLLTLARRKQFGTVIEQRTAALAQAKPFNPVAFNLRLALLEQEKRRTDIHSLLDDSLSNISEVEQVELVQSNSDRLGFDDLSLKVMRRMVSLNTDPVEKLAARLQLAKFYETHSDSASAEGEYSALLSENPNLLGIVRANVDFYWNEKQPKKAVAALEAAASRAQPAYQIQFRREAAQRAADSSDFSTARRLLDGLLTSDPYNADLLAAKAATYASEGDNKSLMEFYAAQLAQLKNAPLSEEEKTQRTAGLRRGYVGALITAKQFIDALEQYQLLLNAYPEDEGLTREIARFAETNHLGDRLTKYYEKATADSPRNYRWPMVLGRIDTSLRRYPEAVAALDKATYVRPDRADLFIAKADLETRLLRFEDAIKTYQKLYEASYHDSQYLALQASLHARLGHNAEAVRLLKAAYVDAHPKELNGYVEVMTQLAGWHCYTEVDQIYKEAKPLLQPNAGSEQPLANLEAQALVAMRHPVEALQEVVSIRRATSAPKHPWGIQSQVQAIGAAVDDFYTPEEKADFASKMEAPNGVPSEINIYDLARASGFTELTAKRLYRSAIVKPNDLWQTLATLQSARLRDAELATQLESIIPLQKRPESTNAALLAAYSRAGDETNELRLSQARLNAGASLGDMNRYARLLIQSHADLPAKVKGLNAENANRLVQELLPMVSEEQALALIQARGASLSPLWTHAYSALTGLYFSSGNAQAEFDATLGPRTVGAQMSANKNDSLRGEGWFYYAARYGDYLTMRKNPAALDLLPATVEAAPVASNSYVALGDDQFELGQYDAAVRAYEQALELAPGRADVQVRLADVAHARKRTQEAVEHLKAALEILSGSTSTEEYPTMQTVFIRMNQYQALKELRPAVDALLAAVIKENGSFQFPVLVEGLLTDAPDRKAAVAWVLQLGQSPEEMVRSPLLTDAEKKPFYLLDIQRKRAAITHANGEEAAQAKESLRLALTSYTKYLDNQGDAQGAWATLHEIEPKTERPADLQLELAAKTGRLAETLAQYDAASISAPAGDQMLVIAAGFRKTHPEWSLAIREWEYRRELLAEGAPSSAYFGMAEVRIEQKRTDEALTLIRDVTLSVGTPFQNLAAAINLLEKTGLSKNAADYAREWRTAEPWNQEAVWAVARTTQDKGLIDSLRKSPQAEYSLRAEAARSLRELKAPVNGGTELDLLTHATVSPQEASQPFFVLARLRAKLYAEAIAMKPTLHEARLALAEQAFADNKNALGMAAWRSYDASHTDLSWLHSASLERAVDREPDRTLKVEEMAAAVLSQQQQYAAAEALYGRILQQETPDKSLKPRIEKLNAGVRAKAQVEQVNRSRAPVITQEFAQAGIVKARLAGGTE